MCLQTGYKTDPGFAPASTYSTDVTVRLVASENCAFLSPSTFLIGICEPIVLKRFDSIEAGLSPLGARGSIYLVSHEPVLMPADLRVSFRLSAKRFFGRPLGLVPCWSSE